MSISTRGLRQATQSNVEKLISEEVIVEEGISYLVQTYTIGYRTKVVKVEVYKEDFAPQITALENKVNALKGLQEVAIAKEVVEETE